MSISNSSFYYNTDFSNKWTAEQVCAYALDIKIEEWIKSLLEFDATRIVYASNDFCFRERTRKTKGTLELPFLNYYRTGYSKVDRPWFNNYANLVGVMDVANENYEKTLGMKLKLTPLRIEYEANAFFSQEKDAEYALSRILVDDSNETILFPEFTTSNGDTVKNIAIQSFDIEFNPTYQESEWLDSNKIWSIGMNWYFDTYIIIGQDTDISIAKEVILNFLSTKGTINKDSVLDTSPQELITEYFTAS